MKQMNHVTNTERKQMPDTDDLFSDRVGDHILGAIQVDIEEHLFEQWNNSNLDEGNLYAEWRFFEFATPEIKKQYNEHYGYVEGDEYYL
jgi:hypothetical protein